MPRGQLGKPNGMSKTVLYGVIAVLVGVIAAGGIIYYNHKQNTLFEVNVGGHAVSVERH